jgi:hypothetical protein
MIGMNLIVHAIGPTLHGRLTNTGPNLRMTLRLVPNGLENLLECGHEPHSQARPARLVSVGSLIVLVLSYSP